MAEAEEVITDVARHATVFVRDLWRRYGADNRADAHLQLSDVTHRLSLLVFSVFGTWYDIRPAQEPAPPTLLRSLFGGRHGPACSEPVPATDGRLLWLPSTLNEADPAAALQQYRTMALQQAMRAFRGSADPLADAAPDIAGEIHLLLEALSADEDLVHLLPGTRQPVNALRRASLNRRPPLSGFPAPARPLETFARRLMQSECGSAVCLDLKTGSPAESWQKALFLARELQPVDRRRPHRYAGLLKNAWTGDLLAPEAGVPGSADGATTDDDDDDSRTRASRMPRRPKVRRPAPEDEGDDRDGGIWMLQADEPHEKAEDPMGIQRPTDRDDHPHSQQLGDMLGELPEARLVWSPGRPREVLLSDDPPPATTGSSVDAGMDRESLFTYPEWDYRRAAYRLPGATVRVFPPETGSREWVERILAEHRAMLAHIRRRFEMLRARRVVQKRQTDGDEIDLDACIDALADLRAGTRLPENLYQRCRPAQRDTAIMLLVDASGSTDAWVGSHRRIIDVEREALLLVCIALREMGASHCVRAFSGEGPDAVTVRPIMEFDEIFDDDIALRIAALEPERYTRAGAAIRHVSAELMQQNASHRLLLMLSDGKPNDVDEYEGRYGIEDVRQAVAEARMQGINPFCLTIDRQASAYLPWIFGANQYAMLPKPELLPAILLDWMRRLIATRQT